MALRYSRRAGDKTCCDATYPQLNISPFAKATMLGLSPIDGIAKDHSADASCGLRAGTILASVNHVFLVIVFGIDFYRRYFRQSLVNAVFDASI